MAHSGTRDQVGYCNNNPSENDDALNQGGGWGGGKWCECEEPVVRPKPGGSSWKDGVH